MHSQSSESKVTRALSVRLLLLLVLPLLAYAAVMVGSVRHRSPVAFDDFDVALLVAVLVYVFVGMWLAAYRPPMYTARFLACVYSTLMAVGFLEMTIRLAFPPLRSTPQGRIHRVYFPSADLPGMKGPLNSR